MPPPSNAAGLRSCGSGLMHKIFRQGSLELCKQAIVLGKRGRRQIGKAAQDPYIHSIDFECAQIVIGGKRQPRPANPIYLFVESVILFRGVSVNRNHVFLNKYVSTITFFSETQFRWCRFCSDHRAFKIRINRVANHRFRLLFSDLSVSASLLRYGER